MNVIFDKFGLINNNHFFLIELLSSRYRSGTVRFVWVAGRLIDSVEVAVGWWWLWCIGGFHWRLWHLDKMADSSSDVGYGTVPYHSWCHSSLPLFDSVWTVEIDSSDERRESNVGLICNRFNPFITTVDSSKINSLIILLSNWNLVRSHFDD